MKDFLIQNWATILIVAIFLAYIVYLVVNKKWDQLRATAYFLMLKAEKTITGTKRGRERFEVVFRQVYSLIPPWLQFFITESMLKDQLQKWYNYIKDYMDDGKVNQSY